MRGKIDDKSECRGLQISQVPPHPTPSKIMANKHISVFKTQHVFDQRHFVLIKGDWNTVRCRSAIMSSEWDMSVSSWQSAQINSLASASPEDCNSARQRRDRRGLRSEKGRWWTVGLVWSGLDEDTGRKTMSHSSDRTTCHFPLPLPCPRRVEREERSGVSWTIILPVQQSFARSLLSACRMGIVWGRGAGHPRGMGCPAMMRWDVYIRQLYSTLTFLLQWNRATQKCNLQARAVFSQRQENNLLYSGHTAMPSLEVEFDVLTEGILHPSFRTITPDRSTSTSQPHVFPLERWTECRLSFSLIKM